MMRIRITLILMCFVLLTNAQSKTDSTIVKAKEEPLKFKYTFVPLPNYDPSTKFGISLVNMFTYKPNMKDTISPYSTGGIGIQFTSNGSMIGGFGNTLYLKEDRWRLTGQGVLGRVHQKLALGFEGGTSARRMIYVANVQALRKVYKRLYFGLGYSYRKVEYKGRDDQSTEELEQVGLLGGEGNHGIKYFLTQDKRDNIMYPYKGYYVGLRVEQYLKGDVATAYTANYLDYRHFFNTGMEEGKHMIAYRILSRFLGGDPLEQNYTYYGRSGGDITRGYETGEYIDKNMFNFEAEYRLKTRYFKEKLGFVGFTGIGKVFGAYNDFNDAEWLPMIGAGVRYLVVPQNRMNIRFDIAIGNEGPVYYFGIREAF